MAKRDTADSKQEQLEDQAQQEDICFTIMPFGGWRDKYYVDVFKPAIEAAGLIPCRADDLYRPGTIINDIWMYTKQARIILADLSSKNPNVLYELGLAHAIAKPAILVTESVDDIPFDLRALRVIEYDKNAPNWGDILMASITQSIAEVLSAPLKAILPTFLEVVEAKGKANVTLEQKEVMELRHEIAEVKALIHGQGIGVRGREVSAGEAMEWFERNRSAWIDTDPNQ